MLDGMFVGCAEGGEGGEELTWYSPIRLLPQTPTNERIYPSFERTRDEGGGSPHNRPVQDES